MSANDTYYSLLDLSDSMRTHANTFADLAIRLDNGEQDATGRRISEAVSLMVGEVLELQRKVLLDATVMEAVDHAL